MAYAVVRRLGRGGMGIVDLATSTDGTEVALKRLALHGSAADMARARQRIRREAQVLRGLEHPGIVRLLDVVDDGDDLVLVMPYLPGGSLAERVAASGPLAPSEVHTLADHLLDALAVAHRSGVVHRDIKPGNVLFGVDGEPLLADFGVALSRDATPGLTATDLVVGTPGFMAPEQARGDVAGPASDVFALGATLAFAATGRSPFGRGDPHVLMYRAAQGKIERLPRTLPPDLRRRLAPLLEPRPERRPTAAAARGGPSGTAPRTALRRAFGGGGGGGGVRRPGSRRTIAITIAAAAAVLAVAATGALLLATRDDGEPAAAATTRPAVTTSTTIPCDPLPYQPCGGSPAPFTDGRACVDRHDDYDGITENGCEAAPDALEPDGGPLAAHLDANLVPRDDIDEYVVEVADHTQLLCDGEVRFTLTAPAGVAQRLDVLDEDGSVLGSATSADRDPGSVRLGEPSCFGNDSTTLTARVTSIGDDRAAGSYQLERSGSY